MKIALFIVLMVTAAILPIAASFIPENSEEYSTGAWLGTVVLLLIAAIVLDRYKREKDQDS